MSSSLNHRRIAFTSPESYGEFLRSRLVAKGAVPLWIPTIQTQISDRTRETVKRALIAELHQASGIAFTSRNGISALAEILPHMALPDLPTPFLLGALGRDATALTALGALVDHPHCQVICPAIATPDALVAALGDGQQRKILCPVPEVLDLPEPDVVPDFLQALRDRHWQPVRVNAYETRPLNPVHMASNLTRLRNVDALIFTSTAEASSFIKTCQTLDIDPQALMQDWVVATHGPVTARGIEKLGLSVTLISSNSTSFGGVIVALEQYFSTTA